MVRGLQEEKMKTKHKFQFNRWWLILLAITLLTDWALKNQPYVITFQSLPLPLFATPLLVFDLITYGVLKYEN
jgi:hypothetical protein